MIFIDLEEKFMTDTWRGNLARSREEYVHKRHVDAIKDMYYEVVVSVRTIEEKLSTFPNIIGS